ncbi:MAG: hypothetical protein NZL99_07900 [Burkholderiaceae bacterium]|nr:hypothetical protein [Burkholderiaceae bacterium]MCX8004423.1 hypothetical protein [Burkholderiaceae bacterium]
MEIVFVVSTPEGARLLAPLARACRRRARTFGAFLTHAAVAALREPELAQALAGAARAVVCKESWLRYVGSDVPCPVELGSQTTNSLLCKQAGRIVSL